MVNRHTFFALAAALLMLVCLSHPAFAAMSGTGGGPASTAGDSLLSTLQNSVTGSIGFFIGLAITVLGLWTWIVKQETGAGITMIIGGVLITLVPNIFNGVHDLAEGVMQNFSSSGNSVRVTY